jgi:4-hydroxybenzoate polyprenyltransferase
MKWWTYQAERFPLIAHGPLIASFSACAVSYVALLPGQPSPTWPAYTVAFIVCLLFFLQLRIADEFKDFEDDSRWRPYRPIPRGLVKLSELRIIFIAAAIIQASLAFTISPNLIWVLFIGWAYLALMSVEFFCRHWLKKRPVIYLITHMGIMPLVDLFATACHWAPQNNGIPQDLTWFLAASFCNGLVIELGRKLRQPSAEEQGVETYSSLWGKKRAATSWLACLILTLLCAAKAAHIIHFATPLLIAMSALLLLAIFTATRYIKTNMKGTHLEKIAALWTLTLYLMLGIIPLCLKP